jgi:hypothetical protein
MKKLWILSIMLAVALMGYSQATPGKIVRVAARTTTFDTNLPAGTQIYCIADSTNWNVKAAGVASTRTINTAWAAAEIEWIRTTLQVNYNADSVNLEVDTLKASYHQVVIKAATTDHAGAMTAADKTKLDGLTTGGGVYTSEAFEAVGDSLTVTGSGYYTVTLAVAAKDSAAFTVSVNGQELRHIAAGKYTVMVPDLAAKRVQLNIPVYKYDLIMVSYMK